LTDPVRLRQYRNTRLYRPLARTLRVYNRRLVEGLHARGFTDFSPGFPPLLSNLDVEGTRIVSETVSSVNPVKSIACKRGITVVNIRSLRMLMAHGFLRRIFEVFDRYRTPVDMVSTSEVSVSLTIDHTEQMGEIEAELSKIAEVSVLGGQAIICLVGDAIRETPGVSARVFAALKEINVRMISQGASLLNLSVVVEEGDLVRAVKLLHAEFFSQLDPEVFG
jgi:aspartate kinase